MIPMLVLLVASVGSVTYISFQTLNYLNYYAALSQVAVEVQDLSVMPPSQSNITVTITFAVSNPTSYMGLLVHSIPYMAKLPSEGTLVLIASPAANSKGQGEPLGAHSSIRLSSDFVLTGLAMKQFQELCATSQNALTWIIDANLVLGTRDGDLSPQFELSPTSSC